jgi:hypothetical protein
MDGRLKFAAGRLAACDGAWQADDVTRFGAWVDGGSRP